MRSSLPARLLQLIIGLALFGAGLGLMIQSELGNPPWDVFHEGVSLHTRLTIGNAVIATSFGVLLLWIPLREKPGIGTIANAVLVGVFLDITIAAVEPPTQLAVRIALLLGGLVVVGLGSGVYIGARLGTGPRDGVMTGIARRGVSLTVARTAIEATVFVIGWMLGGTVGIGTAVFAFGIGPLVELFLPRFDRGERGAPVEPEARSGTIHP